jgi:hypothetical protein
LGASPSGSSACVVGMRDLSSREGDLPQRVAAHRRRPAYHVLRTATGCSRWQRIWLVSAASAVTRFATDCHGAGENPSSQQTEHQQERQHRGCSRSEHVQEVGPDGERTTVCTRSGTTLNGSDGKSPVDRRLASSSLRNQETYAFDSCGCRRLEGGSEDLQAAGGKRCRRRPDFAPRSIRVCVIT